MHSDNVNIVKATDAIKGILDAVPTGCSTRHQTMRDVKTVLSAQVLPHVHLTLGQGHNYINRTVPIFPKSLDCVHQDGLSLQGKELLGHLSAESRSTAPSHYNRNCSHLNSVIYYDHKIT